LPVFDLRSLAPDRVFSLVRRTPRADAK